MRKPDGDSAGDFLSLLLRPLSQRVDAADSMEHARELKASALNCGKQRLEFDEGEEEFYDVAFVFPAHPRDLDSPRNLNSRLGHGHIGPKGVRHILSQICVYRTMPLASGMRSQYSLAFHRQATMGVTPNGVWPNRNGSFMRMASQALTNILPNLIKPASLSRSGSGGMIELSAQRAPLCDNDVEPLSPPLIEVGPGEFYSGGVTSLSSFYKLDNILMNSEKSLWRAEDLHYIVRSVFIDCMRRLGAYVTTVSVDDKVVVKMRLNDNACMEAAEQLRYHLRVGESLRRVGTDKYCVFDRAIPADHWQTYDALSQPIYDPQSNPHGSIFRDIDRIRLLMLQLQAHFNLGIMMSDMKVDDGEGRITDLKPCVKCCFPLHRTHIQQYLVDSGQALSTREIDLVDERIRKAYYGEEVTGYFLYTKLLLWSLIGPGVFGIVHAIIKLLIIATREPTSTFTPPANQLNYLELSYATCFVIYLTCWVEKFLKGWYKNSARLRAQTSEHTRSATPTLSNGLGNGYMSGDSINCDRIARDFERFDFQFEYYKVGEDGDYIKFEDPTARLTRKILACLMTGWVFFSLIFCLILTFYARSYSAVYLKRKQLNIVEPDRPPTKLDSYMDALMAELVLPLFEPDQTLNYVQTAMIIFFDRLWNKAIVRILKLENHRFEADYRKSLVGKSCCFKFLNHFVPLLYSAVVAESHLAFQNQLIVQLACQTLGNFAAIIFIIFKQLRAWRYTYENKAGSQPSAIGIQVELPQYDLAILTQDFIDLIIQLTQVLFFSAMCPIIPVFVGIRCVLQLLTQNYRFSILHKRLITHEYPTALEPVLSAVASLTTPLSLALLLYSDKINTVRQKLVAFVVLENVVMVLKLLTKYTRLGDV